MPYKSVVDFHRHVIERFLQDRCTDVRPDLTVCEQASVLFRAYADFCTAADRRVASMHAFALVLIDLGFERSKSNIIWWAWRASEA